MNLNSNWSYPTTIWFGAGRISELADACKFAGLKRPLVVTDRGLASQQITLDLLNLLKREKIDHELFADVDSNPTDANLDAGILAFKDGNHDGVIAFGGGSGLDLGKLVAFMVGQDRPVWDFEDVGDWWKRAHDDRICPIIAIPTTAGTGSEVGRAGVLTNSSSKVKKIIFHPKILPTVVICDPELTVGMPKSITVGTGMDAFAHCLEAYSSPFYHPMSQGIALEGMRLVKENLPVVVKDGNNLEARANMMSAAAMGAVGFQKGLGAIHSLSHPIGALYNTHHGMTNAVVMPAVLRFNRSAIEERINSVAAYLGISDGFDGFLKFVEELRSEIGVPDKLAELGVGNDRIDELAAMAVKDPTAAANPIELTKDTAKNLLQECM